MDRLPTDILTRIVAFCPTGRPSRSEACLAPYALISKQWQKVVEQHVFSSVKLKFSELATFAAVYDAGLDREHRRSALQRLKYIIRSIPGTDEALASETSPERTVARQKDTQAALHALGEIYRLLSSWSINKPITLEIQFPQETTLPPDSMSSIPRTELVKRFVFESTFQLDTALLVPIASQMIGLQEIEWDLDDYDKSINSVFRRKARYDFAKHVQSLAGTCPSLRTVELRFNNETPSNENIDIPSILLPHVPIDHLCHSLRQLSSMTRLRTLILHKIVLSEQFFQQSQLSSGSTTWPSLSRLEINYSSMAADGGWYFERDPYDGEYIDETEDDSDMVSQRLIMERIHKSQEEKAKVTDFDQEYDPRATEEDENQDLDDLDWADSFRVWPSPKLEAMLISMAKSAAQMPALKIFTVGSDMSFCAEYQLFQFFYLTPGETHANCLLDFAHDSKHRHQRRLYWRVPRSWRMNEELKRTWRDLLGEDGVIQYHDWHSRK